MYQKVEVNWDVFQNNFSADPRSAFERLSYLLFCFEFNQPHGVFRYFNQPYIETSPIQVGTDCIGFQAKYYDAKVSLRARKPELEEAINGAKHKYPGINRLIFYVNKEFTSSSAKNREKPAYLTEIEECGISSGIAVEWRTLSNFEAMLFRPGLEAVRDCYFCPTASGIGSFLSQISEHSKTVFENIDSDIRLKDTTIKTPRRDLDLESFFQSSAHYLVIHGESGAGKSGLVKDCFQNETTFPVFLFKATDFDAPDVSAFSRTFGECTFEDFLAGFDSCLSPKLCIIDSAEKVFVMNHLDTCLDIVRLFIQHGWKIIVTIRTAFKSGFVDSVLCTQDYQEYELRRISAEELSHLESAYGLALPTDTKLRDLLRNLFYLKLYVSSATEGSSPSNTIERFITRIWDETIRNVASKKDNLDIRRETAICTIVLSNANEGVSYYAHRQDDDDEAISALAQSGIVADDKTMGGCYVTHDVYEELVLKHIMRTAFNRKQSCEDFFSKIGNSLVVRKAFRLWLHDVLEAQLDEVSGFIVEALNSAHVEPTWKDDVLIALMNESDERILHILSGPLGLNNYALFFRAVSLLNTGCKVINREFLEQVYTPQELESYNVYRYTKPEGRGWDFMFRYANDHKANINWNPISIGLVTEALYSWAINCHEGAATKKAGQVALYLYDLVETDDQLRYKLNDAKYRKIIGTILNSAQEILPELAPILERVISEKTVDHRGRYYDLCKQLLGGELGDSYPMCKAAPDLVISLAKHFWLQQDKENGPMDSPLGVGTDFGLNSHMDYEYYPSSAFQTPTFSLLQQSPKKALDFIVDLFDATTEHYAASSLNTRYNECSQMTIHLPDGRTVQQVASSRLWQMYRGASVAPELLVSILMALERWLCFLVQDASEEVSVSVCLRLLQSHSAAVTAVVVSIVTAYPDKLFKVACILLHSKEIILFDLSRFLSEMGVNFGRGLNSRHEQFDKERISSNALPFRKKRLEDVVVEYQMPQGGMTDEQFRERRDTLYNNLDSSYADLDSLAPGFRFAYYRMDLRKRTVSVEPPTEPNGDTRICLVPSLPEDLVKMQKDTEETINKSQKLEPLLLWCRARYERRKPDYEKFANYENDPHTALKESLEVCAGDPAQISFLQRAIPIYVSAVLLRDFSTSIGTEEIHTCTGILTHHLYLVVEQNRGSQVLDGTDAAIALLPRLLSEYRNSSVLSFEDPAILMLALLLSRGNSRELAVKSFREGVFCSIPGVSSCIIGAFVTLKPDYDKEFSRHNGISPVSFLQKNRDCIEVALARQTGYEDLPYNNLDYGALQTLSMLVPPGDDSSMNFVINLGSSIWPQMFNDQMHGNKHNEFRDYGQEMDYISWLAEYVLCSRPETQHTVVQGLASYLKDCNNTEYLLRDIIWCEDRLQKCRPFWHLWDDELFSTVEGLCASQRASLGENEYKGEYHGGTLGEIVTTFSLAFPWWTENIRSWHTLKTEDWPFFVKLTTKLGYHPCVLYSIARVLDTIGFEFLDRGIDCVSTIVEDNPHLVQIPLQVNTEYYLEEYMQRFIRAHRNDMKGNPEMRRKVIGVLSFLVDRGSTCGFMLREDI
jgi:hypothetical protein